MAERARPPRGRRVRHVTIILIAAGFFAVALGVVYLFGSAVRADDELDRRWNEVVGRRSGAEAPSASHEVRSVPDASSAPRAPPPSREAPDAPPPGGRA